jgi:hypothetical protein
MMLWNSVPPAALELVGLDAARLLSEPRFASMGSLDVTRLRSRLNLPGASPSAAGGLHGPHGLLSLPSLSAVIASSASGGKITDKAEAMTNGGGTHPSNGVTSSSAPSFEDQHERELHAVLTRTLVRQGRTVTLATVLAELFPPSSSSATEAGGRGVVAAPLPLTPRKRDLLVAVIASPPPPSFGFDSGSESLPSPPLLAELVRRYLRTSFFPAPVAVTPHPSSSSRGSAVLVARSRGLAYIVGLALLRAPREEESDSDGDGFEQVGNNGNSPSEIDKLARDLEVCLVDAESAHGGGGGSNVIAVRQFRQALASISGLGERWPDLVRVDGGGRARDGQRTS